MGGGRKTPDDQGDLFAASSLFPVRARSAHLRSPDLSLRIKTAMGQALKDCPDPAAVVAARMSEMLGREISADALYSYTAPSKPEHEISLIRFVAFVRATGAPWLWDVLVEDEGLVVIAGEDANFAQLGALRQRRSQLDDMIRGLERELKTRPGPAPRGRRPLPNPPPQAGEGVERSETGGGKTTRDVTPADLAARMRGRPRGQR